MQKNSYSPWIRTATNSCRKALRPTGRYWPLAAAGLDPASEQVQQEIGIHYRYILQFWGKAGNQAAAYKGLGDLLANDERYTQANGVTNPAFGKFMQQAIHVYAERKLQ